MAECDLSRVGIIELTLLPRFASPGWPVPRRRRHGCHRRPPECPPHAPVLARTAPRALGRVAVAPGGRSGALGLENATTAGLLHAGQHTGQHPEQYQPCSRIGMCRGFATAPHVTHSPMTWRPRWHDSSKVRVGFIGFCHFSVIGTTTRPFIRMP